MLPYNFAFTLKGNLNLNNDSQNKYYSAEIGDGKSNNGRLRRTDIRQKDYTFQQQLHWRQEYGVHAIDALLGHESYNFTRNFMYAGKDNEIVPNMTNLLNFTDPAMLYDITTTIAWSRTWVVCAMASTAVTTSSSRSVAMVLRASLSMPVGVTSGAQVPAG